MKQFFFILFVIGSCSSFAQIVLECVYNVNGIQNSSLCVIPAGSDNGKCHVLSNMGNCWFDAYYQNHGNYTTITMSNPSEYGWIAGTFYFLSGGTNYVVFRGNKFPVPPHLVPQQGWNRKKSQYGFNSVSFKANKPEDAIGKECTHNFSGNHKKSGVTKCPGFQNKPNDRVWCLNCGCSYEAH